MPRHPLRALYPRAPGPAGGGQRGGGAGGAAASVSGPVASLFGRAAPARAGAAGCRAHRGPVATRATARNQLQIFNIEMKSKVKSYTMPEGQEIKHWCAPHSRAHGTRGGRGGRILRPGSRRLRRARPRRRWISTKEIALVTQAAVFHWSMDGDSAPRKMFDRHASLNECQQIISYGASDDGKWMVVIGILRGASGLEGRMQLYSVERGVSQAIPGSAGAFVRCKVRPGQEPAQLFVFAQRKPGSPQQLFVMEVGAPAGSAPFKLSPQTIPFPADGASDLPIAMHAEPRGVAFMITQAGLLFLFDIHSGTALYRQRISTEPVFASCLNTRQSGGVLGVTARSGRLISVSLNEQKLVPFVMGTLRNNALALQLAQRLDLPGAEDLYSQQFEQMMQQGNTQGAAKLAAQAPRGLLRTPETLQRFAQLPQQAGQPAPLMSYLHTLMQSGKLNAFESVELAKPVLQQGRAQLLAKWLQEEKLECSEELGDMVAGYDPKIALSIYVRAEASDKVISMLVRTGDYAKIIAYAKKTGARADYTSILRSMVQQNPKGAEEFAKQLANNEGGPLIDVNAAVDAFMGFNRVQEATAFLLEALKGDREEDAALQTRVLEINLMGGTPNVADAILGGDMFSHYDRLRIAQMCERAQLYTRALENYEDINDIKRVVVQTHMIKPEWLVEWLGKQEPDRTLECLGTLLQHNPRANMQLVVNAATRNHERLGTEAVIEMFERQVNYQALYFFLGSIVASSDDPNAHYKYVEAAIKVGQLAEVERVCRESAVFDPAQVKQLLIDSKLKDPRPLIHVCDRFGFVDELTAYLHGNNMSKYIEVYVTKVSPQRTPMVVGKLLDLDANEDFVKGLLDGVRGACPVEPLVEEVEKRNRLRMVRPWLEARVSEGNTEPATHNALGKILITLNQEPQQFLLNNNFYDSRVIGKFCEKLDPYLAYLAYRRAGGECDDELIEVTNANGLFKDQARYLVERQDLELWGRVLTDDNEHKEKLVEQVVGTALPETKNPEEVSTTVKAFMTADLPHELIGLLERLVLQGSDFAQNKNLQNLLILTAIKAAPQKVMDFINRLDSYDGPQIAEIAASDQYSLYEEALAIYRKFEHHEDAVAVLIDKIEDLQRAYEYAERVDVKDVWARLARAQLAADMVPECVASFLHADDASLFVEVIEAANRTECFEDLVRYLAMARGKTKEQRIDSELIYAYAKTEQLAELEEFVASPNVAQIQTVGDRCFDEGLYEAARILFNNVSNNAKLAVCLVRLDRFRDAVDAATKANSVRTWKDVNEACVKAGEFSLSERCGLHIIVSPDHLEELVAFYERQGHIEQLIQLLERGLGLDAAHPGIFTELGIMYSRYRPEQLMEHIKVYWQRCHIPKLLRACEEGRHWREAAFLFIESGDADEAVRVMVDHSPTAFQPESFLEAVKKVRNAELYYRAIQFYLDEQPLQLGKLLKALTPNLEHTRVVHMLTDADALPLCVDYLRSVQGEDIKAVNEALNGLYIEEEKYEELRESITEHTNFDQLDLAQKLQTHYLIEFRRIAALLYKRNKKYEQSINLSKKDSMFKDAVDTAAASGSQALSEDLLRYFEEIDERECFAAALYTCYDLIRPDIGIEIAWRKKWVDFVMPYVLQYIREVHTRLADVEERLKPAEEARRDDEEAAGAAVEASFYPTNAPLAIAATAYNPGMGMQPGMQPGMGGMQGGMGGGMHPGMQPGMGSMPMQPGMGGMGGMGGGMGGGMM